MLPRERGLLVDLRPVHSNPALEILTAAGVTVAGHIDDAGGAPDDHAADRAIAAVVDRGCFTLTEQDAFEFANYWDTLAGVVQYADERWRDFATIPAPVVKRAQREIARARQPYRIRIRRRIHIAVYRTGQ